MRHSLKKNKHFSQERARCRGLEVRQKTHYLEVVGSNPCRGDHFSCTIYLDQNHEINNCGMITWHCCMCCNRTHGRVESEDFWLIKPSCITMDHDQIPKKTTFFSRDNKYKIVSKYRLVNLT